VADSSMKFMIAVTAALFLAGCHDDNQTAQAQDQKPHNSVLTSGTLACFGESDFLRLISAHEPEWSALWYGGLHTVCGTFKAGTRVQIVETDTVSIITDRKHIIDVMCMVPEGGVTYLGNVTHDCMWTYGGITKDESVTPQPSAPSGSWENSRQVIKP
jgi:hypothetical protein